MGNSGSLSAPRASEAGSREMLLVSVRSWFPEAVRIFRGDFGGFPSLIGVVVADASGPVTFCDLLIGARARGILLRAPRGFSSCLGVERPASWSMSWWAVVSASVNTGVTADSGICGRVPEAVGAAPSWGDPFCVEVWRWVRGAAVAGWTAAPASAADAAASASPSTVAPGDGSGPSQEAAGEWQKLTPTTASCSTRRPAPAAASSACGTACSGVRFQVAPSPQVMVSKSLATPPTSCRRQMRKDLISRLQASPSRIMLSIACKEPSRSLLHKPVSRLSVSALSRSST
mmetsp:Transcript_59169/g.129608  ORF Transcript_59169/g.129608 Transcript_59169/m.129608 type:complete len:288 (-) Transcript_59169:72-935(-)